MLQKETMFTQKIQEVHLIYPPIYDMVYLVFLMYGKQLKNLNTKIELNSKMSCSGKSFQDIYMQ